MSLSLPAPDFSGILAMSVYTCLLTKNLVFGSVVIVFGCLRVEIRTQCIALRVCLGSGVRFRYAV